MKHKPVAELAGPLLEVIASQQSKTGKPCFVALDGRSGSGKSTLAAHIASTIPPVSIIEGDEFYTGGGYELWSSRSAHENAQCCIDWKRQYSVISTLKSEGFATWRAFDWHSEYWESDTVPYCSTETSCPIANIVLLEGVYSARKELSSLIDIRVMLEVPEALREKRLADRDGENARTDWNKLWSNAEQYYFEHMLNRQSLSLMLA